MTTAAARRTKRPTLSREAVITAALQLADDEGLDAVTIRRLAGEMGVTPMALYWHVKDKDELLAGLGERLFALIELPPLTRRPWHQQLRPVLATMTATLRAHPAVASLAFQAVLASESGLVVAERILGLLRAGGLGPQAAAQTGTFLLTSIVSMVIEDDAHVGEEITPDKLQHKAQLLQRLSSSEFPNVAELGGYLMACGEDDRFFDNSLDLLMRGIRARSQV